MEMKVHLTRATVKQIEQVRQQAFRAGDVRVIKRTTALVELRGRPVAEVAAALGLSASTVSRWLRAFILDGVSGLWYRTSPGRPPKLTPTQKARLKEKLATGPEAAGYPTACWNAALIQDLLSRAFGVLYNVHYLSALLSSLGYSYRRPASSLIILTRSNAAAGARRPGQPWSARPARRACCCSLATKPALPSGARWATPGRRAASSRWSRPVGGAKPTRSSG
jgi:transposase